MGAAFTAGTTIITWAASDSSGNISTCIQKITVKDAELPTITAERELKICYQPNNSIVEVPAIIAEDNCGIKTIKYLVSGATNRSGSGADASGFFNQGKNTITWTVTDVNGNINTAYTDVLISDQIKIQIPDILTVNPGGALNTIYPDYNSSPAELKVRVSGGIPPYIIRWSDGSTDSSIVIQPSGLSSYLYQVSVTDGSGCVAIQSKEIKAVYVRCGARMDDVVVCVPENNVFSNACVSQEVAAKLLGDGAYLGTCNEIVVPQVQLDPGTYRIDSTYEVFLRVNPNPSQSSFVLTVRGDNPMKTFNMKVYSTIGELIEVRNNLPAKQTVQFGNHYRPGSYFVEVTQGLKKSHIIIIKR
jgi:hypothetical protein